jgi:wingless-type MMTV integration site family protein 4
MKLFSLLKLSIFITIFALKYSEASLSWLSISRLDNLNLFDHSTCRKLIGWTGMQRRFCRQYFGFTDTIRTAAKLTLSECQGQFKNRRWNCSSIARPQLFGHLPEVGLREGSFVYALSSAALTYSITSACSKGKLTGCSCDESRKGKQANGYQWSGCSDNIAYGMGVAENFLDPRIRNKPNLMLINLHNLETGRKVSFCS